MPLSAGNSGNDRGNPKISCDSRAISARSRKVDLHSGQFSVSRPILPAGRSQTAPQMLHVNLPDSEDVKNGPPVTIVNGGCVVFAMNPKAIGTSARVFDRSPRYTNRCRQVRSKMRNAKHGLLFAALTIAAVAAADDAPRRLAARAIGDTPIFDDLRELCDGVGGRPTGSPAAFRSIEWAARKFKAAGIERVSLEPFKIPNLWLPGTAEASATAPEQFTVRVAAAPFTSSTEGTLEARVVDAGEGSEADFAKLGATAKGAIALVHNKEMKTFDLGHARSACCRRGRRLGGGFCQARRNGQGRNRTRPQQGDEDVRRRARSKRVLSTRAKARRRILPSSAQRPRAQSHSSTTRR